MASKRLDRRWSLMASYSIPHININNLTNTNVALTLTEQSGPGYQVPLTIMPPRIVEFSVNHTF